MHFSPPTHPRATQASKTSSSRRRAVGSLRAVACFVAAMSAVATIDVGSGTLYYSQIWTPSVGSEIVLGVLLIFLARAALASQRGAGSRLDGRGARRCHTTHRLCSSMAPPLRVAILLVLAPAFAAGSGSVCSGLANKHNDAARQAFARGARRHLLVSAE